MIDDTVDHGHHLPQETLSVPGLMRDGGASLLASDLPASDLLTTSIMTPESSQSTSLIHSLNEPKSTPGLGSTLLSQVSESSHAMKRNSKEDTPISLLTPVLSSIQLAPPEPVESFSDPVGYTPQNLPVGNEKVSLIWNLSYRF